MISFQFPKMFNSNSSLTVKDSEASMQNIITFLGCEEGDLDGDPFYGIALKRYLFNPNNVILKDILIDEIYTKIAIFVPQIRVNRTDIELIRDRAKLYIKIKGVNQANMMTERYSLVLYEDQE